MTRSAALQTIVSATGKQERWGIAPWSAWPSGKDALRRGLVRLLRVTLAFLPNRTDSVIRMERQAQRNLDKGRQKNKKGIPALGDSEAAYKASSLEPGGLGARRDPWVHVTDQQGCS